LTAAGLLIGGELAAPCPSGGWLAIDCVPARDPVLALIALSAILYVTLLTGVVAWSARLARLPGVDPTGGRDWYLIAAFVGVPIAALLAFNILAGLGWLG
jgi:hypothetical protein